MLALLTFLKEDRQFSHRLIAEWMGIPKTVVQQILSEDLQKWKLCVWFASHTLTAEQKEQCLNHTTLLKQLKATQTFWTQQLLVTRADVLHMIWKQSDKVPNGAVRTHHPPENFDFKNQG